AYRYEPATDAERAVVLRHFPPVAFALADGRSIEVSHVGLASSAADAPVAWDEVKALAFKDSWGSSVLIVTHHDKGLVGARKTKLKLKGIGKQKDAFKGAVGRYWQRHQIMRAEQQARRSESE
ncbi:MAG: peptidase M48, partial [Caldimonas sp.]